MQKEENQKLDKSKWITKKALAARLSCSQRHINNLMRRGVLPFTKVRGFLRFDPDQCDAAFNHYCTRSILESSKREDAAPHGMMHYEHLLGPIPPQPSAGPSPMTQVNVFGSLPELRVFLDENGESNLLAIVLVRSVSRSP